MFYEEEEVKAAFSLLPPLYLNRRVKEEEISSTRKGHQLSNQADASSPRRFQKNNTTKNDQKKSPILRDNDAKTRGKTTYKARILRSSEDSGQNNLQSSDPPKLHNPTRNADWTCKLTDHPTHTHEAISPGMSGTQSRTNRLLNNRAHLGYIKGRSALPSGTSSKSYPIAVLSETPKSLFGDSSLARYKPFISTSSLLPWHLRLLRKSQNP
ncbi:hypothetical protein PIB30_031667 [Stylosanthes scabra]|uniref:Uncharacterized protein n=1 Tax=Stylosanthes scabra TaxID=79078 RepID=A0ABU6YAS1_9FABA|nr:hypothetical protein [Stylosanthes scabra]